MTQDPRPWADRGSRHARGYGAAWERAREARLKRDCYLCQPCKRKGRVTSATEVHHIRSKANGGTDEQDNLESTCSPCHREADLRNRGHRPKRRIGLDGYPVV